MSSNATQQNQVPSVTRAATATESARLSLGILAALAEAIQIPLVKAITLTAYQLIDIANTVKGNKADCLELAERAAQLVIAITKTCQADGAHKINAGLSHDLAELHSDLDVIQRFMTELAGRRIFSRIVTSTVDTNKIKEYNQRLDASTRLFQMKHNIRSQIMMASNHAELLDELRGIKLQIKTLSVTDVPPSFDPSIDVDFSSELPAPPVHFFGRDEAVQQAVDMLTIRDPARIVILGAAGIGKTSVALATIHAPDVMQKFGESRFFIPCDAAVTPGGLVIAIMKVLNVLPSAGDPLKALMGFLRQAPPSLLVFDNFETPWDIDGIQKAVEAITSRIAALRHISLLFTMRGIVRPKGIAWTAPALLPLLPLSEAAALDTFLAICPSVQSLGVDEEHGLGVLLKEVDYIPLAVTLLACLAEDGTRPTELLRLWHTEYTAFLRTGSSERLSNIDISIGISVQSAARKNPDALAYLSLICNMPRGIARKFQEVIAPQHPNVIRLVSILRRVALAYESQDRLCVLSPIRHYMLQCQPTAPQPLAVLYQFYFSLLQNEGAVDIHSAAYREYQAALIPEIENLHFILSMSFKTPADMTVIQAAYDFSVFLKRVRPSTELLELALEHLPASETSMRASILIALAQVLFFTGDMSKALEFGEQAKVARQQDEDRRKYANILRTLSNLYALKGDPTSAQDYCDEAMAIYKDLDDQKGIALCLRAIGQMQLKKLLVSESLQSQLAAQTVALAANAQHTAAEALWGAGHCYFLLHDYPQAEVALSSARDQLADLNEKHDSVACGARLGELYNTRGDYQRASDVISAAMHYYRQVGSEANLLLMRMYLADACAGLGQLEAAETILIDTSAAVAAIKWTGLLPYCFWNLGLVYLIQQRYVESQENVDEAAKQFSAGGPSMQSGLCSWTSHIIFAVCGDFTKSMGALQQGEDHIRHTGDAQGVPRTAPLKSVEALLYGFDGFQRWIGLVVDALRKRADPETLALCLWALGNLQLTLDMLAAATANFQEASQIFASVGHQVGEGYAALSFARLRVAEGTPELAEDELARATALFKAANCPHGLALVQAVHDATNAAHVTAETKPDAVATTAGDESKREAAPILTADSEPMKTL